MNDNRRAFLEGREASIHHEDILGIVLTGSPGKGFGNK
jgi:hypothetical protein